jgi:hypothetical protein
MLDLVNLSWFVYKDSELCFSWYFCACFGGFVLGVIPRI